MKMKRMILILTCAAIGLTCTQAKAQSSFSFGVKAGANLSTITKPDLTVLGPGAGILGDPFKMKYIPGYHLGLYTRYNFNPAMGLQAEVLYSMSGYKLTAPLVEGVAIRTQLHYLNVPVLFRYTVPNTGLYAEIGPQLGFFLKDNVKITGNFGGEKGGLTDSDTDQTAKVDLSGAIGIGYKLDNGIGFSLRYLHEFRTSKDVDRLIPDMSQKRCFQLSVTYDIF